MSTTYWERSHNTIVEARCLAHEVVREKQAAEAKHGRPAKAKHDPRTGEWLILVTVPRELDEVTGGGLSSERSACEVTRQAAWELEQLSGQETDPDWELTEGEAILGQRLNPDTVGRWTWFSSLAEAKTFAKARASHFPSIRRDKGKWLVRCRPLGKKD